MDVNYSTKKGELAIIFTPVEARELSLLMEMVLEEECKKGTCVPDLKKEFFRTFAASSKKVKINFDFMYLGFCIAFLAEVYDEMIDQGTDTKELRKFLGNVSELCSDGCTMH